MTIAMSRSPSPSAIAAARIPKITELRNLLNYGSPILARSSAFIDDLRTFRRRYYAMSFRGIDLWDWKSSIQQEALRQMTASFLDDSGFGEIYWPSDPSSPNFNDLQYSKDRLFISQTVRQLIFRLNLQQYRNEKYKKRDHRSDDFVHDVTELDEEDAPRSNFPNVNSSECTDPPTTGGTHGEENKTSSRSLLNRGSSQTEYDVYADFTSPDPEPKMPKLKRRRDATAKETSTKRSKIVSLKVPASDTAMQTSKPSNEAKTPTKPLLKRVSPRGKATIRRRTMVGFEEIDAFLAREDEDMRRQDEIETEAVLNSQKPEHFEDVLDCIRMNRPSVSSDGIPPTNTEASSQSTDNSNIDPSLEQVTSPPIPDPTPPRTNLHQAHVSNSTSATYDFDDTRQPEPTTGVSPAPRSSHCSTPEIKNPPASPAPVSTSGEPDPPADKPVSTSQIAQKPSKSTPAASRSTANIMFQYIVILSRTPVYQYKCWEPKGRFLEKTFSELITELPLDNKVGIEGLIIRLTGPGVSVEENFKVGIDQERSFGLAKARILRTVKMCLQSNSTSQTEGPVAIEFELEVIRKADVAEETVDDNDLVF